MSEIVSVINGAQGLVVAVIVVACCGYAVWTLMPGVARRALATALLKLPLPGPITQRLNRAAKVASGCGCDGCDRSEVATKAASPATQKQAVVTFHPRLPR